MNKAQRVVWTVYLGASLFLFVRIVGIPTHTRAFNLAAGQLSAFLLSGLAFAIILHFIWRDKKGSS